MAKSPTVGAKCCYTQVPAPADQRPLNSFSHLSAFYLTLPYGVITLEAAFGWLTLANKDDSPRRT
jgi:hypothetical protein